MGEGKAVAFGGVLLFPNQAFALFVESDTVITVFYQMLHFVEKGGDCRMDVFPEVHAVNPGVVLDGKRNRRGFPGNFFFQVDDFCPVGRIQVDFGNGHAVMQRVYPAGRVVDGNLDDGVGSAAVKGVVFDIFEHSFHQAGAPVNRIDQNGLVQNQVFVFYFRLVNFQCLIF